MPFVVKNPTQSALQSIRLIRVPSKAKRIVSLQQESISNKNHRTIKKKQSEIIGLSIQLKYSTITLSKDLKLQNLHNYLRRF